MAQGNPRSDALSVLEDAIFKKYEQAMRDWMREFFGITESPRFDSSRLPQWQREAVGYWDGGLFTPPPQVPRIEDVSTRADPLRWGFPTVSTQLSPLQNWVNGLVKLPTWNGVVVSEGLADALEAHGQEVDRG